MASDAHQTFTQQYTQQHLQETVLAAGNVASSNILVGDAAEQAMAAQAAAAPTPPYGTPTPS
jgi:hypothetical protein